MWRGFYGLLLLLLVGTVDAATIQYRLDTNDITGVSDRAMQPVEGYGVIQLVEPMSAIVWPVPAGCASGQAFWTRLSDPAMVTAAGAGMSVRPDVLIFTTTSTLLTSCQQVRTWAELRGLVSQTIIDAVQTFDFLQALNDVNVIVQVVCPASNGTANCVNARASMAAINAVYPNPGAAANATSQMAQLLSDAQQFKLDHGL